MRTRFVKLIERWLSPDPTRLIARRPRLTLQALEGREVPSGNPLARDDAYSLHQGAASTVLGSVLANDEGGTVALRGYVTTPATLGTTFAFGSYGASVRYKPRAGTIAADGTITSAFVGTDTFQYVLKEGGYTSAPATGTIQVTNDAPVAATTDVTFSTGKNQSFHIGRATLLAAAGVTDADTADTVGVVTADGTKTNVVIATDAGGRAWLNWQTGFSYNPPPRNSDGTLFSGWDSFQVSFWDKAGFSEVVTVHVFVGSGTAPPVVTVGKTHDGAEWDPTTDAPENAAFQFTRTGSTAAALTVSFNVGGTATAPGDYQLAGGGVAFNAATGLWQATFAPGSATLDVQVVVKEDEAVDEGTETVTVSLAEPTGSMYHAPSLSPVSASIIEVVYGPSETVDVTGTTLVGYAGDGDDGTGEVGSFEIMPEPPATGGSSTVAAPPAPPAPPPTSANLKWADFEELNERRNPKFVALTAYGYDMPRKARLIPKEDTKGGQTTVTYTATYSAIDFKALFVGKSAVSGSWVLKGEQTPALLRHETLHLRIGEYVASKAKANMPELIGKGTSTNAVRKTAADDAKIASLNDLEAKLKTFRDKWEVIGKAVQNKYDDETKHGTLPTEQGDWESKSTEFADKILKDNGWTK